MSRKLINGRLYYLRSPWERAEVVLGGLRVVPHTHCEKMRDSGELSHTSWQRIGSVVTK